MQERPKNMRTLQIRKVGVSAVKERPKKRLVGVAFVQERHQKHENTSSCTKKFNNQKITSNTFSIHEGFKDA